MAKLTEKMQTALVSLLTTGQYPTDVHPATRSALFARGLVDGHHRITQDGVVAATPESDSTIGLPKHLATLTGKRVMVAFVQKNTLVKTFTGRVMTEYLSAPIAGFRIPMVEVSEPFTARRHQVLTGHVVRLAENTTEAKLQQAEAELHDRMRRQHVTIGVREIEWTAPVTAEGIVSGLVSGLQVLADEAEVKPTAAQRLTRLQAESVKAGPCCSQYSRGVDCGCADAAERSLTGFEPEEGADLIDDGVDAFGRRLAYCDVFVQDGPESMMPCGVIAVPTTPWCSDHQTIGLAAAKDRFRPARIRGQVSDRTYDVLGSTLNPHGQTILWVKAVPSTQGPKSPLLPLGHPMMTDAPKWLHFVADCGHGYNVTDTCPNCDARQASDEKWAATRAKAIKAVGRAPHPSTMIGRSTANLPGVETPAFNAAGVETPAFNAAGAAAFGQALEGALQAERQHEYDRATMPEPIRLAGQPAGYVAGVIMSVDRSFSGDRVTVDTGFGIRHIYLAKRYPRRSAEQTRQLDAEVVANTSATEPEEESSPSLAWTDDWTPGDHYRHAGFSVCYSHKACGQRYYVDEYRTMGGLVRAMLNHNMLCGR
jgi:hypothetical protein